MWVPVHMFLHSGVFAHMCLTLCVSMCSASKRAMCCCLQAIHRPELSRAIGLMQVMETLSLSPLSLTVSFSQGNQDSSDFLAAAVQKEMEGKKRQKQRTAYYCLTVNGLPQNFTFKGPVLFTYPDICCSFATPVEQLCTTKSSRKQHI